ncbi:MAG: F0F1 ATP synthase subunit gamma [Ureaplasma sp.]|nr:F0F1 ATP synthase subunit gamma [Ureaplasma sp.]
MSLNQLKRKISSINSTSKITNAMRLISTTKSKKQKNMYDNIKDYFNDFYKIMALLLEDNNLDLLKTSNPDDATLWINITSSMGLCGGYNVGVNNLLLKHIKKEDLIIQIGKKGLDFIKAKGVKNEIARFYDFADKKIMYTTCTEIARYILNELEAGKFNKIKLTYVKFVNAITFEPTIIDIFPINKDFLNSINVNNKSSSYIEFNPNKEEILKNLIPDYIATIIYGALIEAKVSEYSSRRNAMDTATKNADELSEKYTLAYNNLRQTQITNEIIEIISGNSNNKKEGE